MFAPIRGKYVFEAFLLAPCRLFIRNHNSAVFNQQSPGSFLTVLLDLTSKDRAKSPVAFQNEPCNASCRKPKGWSLMKEKPDVLQGTLALMVLKTLDVLGPQHGYGIARRIEQISGDVLAVNQGTLYPLLLKLENEGSIASQWGASENNRRARFYRLTTTGRKQLQAETRHEIPAPLFHSPLEPRRQKARRPAPA